MSPMKSILVAVDFGESSADALRLAIDLTQRFDASLTIIHAYDIPGYAYESLSYIPSDLLTPIEEAARQTLANTLTDVQKTIPAAQSVLRRGPVSQQLLSFIEETKPDLVVVGTHGRHGIAHAVLGSVAEKVVRFSSSPVLTVRAAAKPQAP
jgi:nucleotide-binding universal stress UspA family protein